MLPSIPSRPTIGPILTERLTGARCPNEKPLPRVATHLAPADLGQVLRIRDAGEHTGRRFKRTCPESRARHAPSERLFVRDLFLEPPPTPFPKPLTFIRVGAVESGPAPLAGLAKPEGKCRAHPLDRNVVDPAHPSVAALFPLRAPTRGRDRAGVPP